MNSKYIPGSDLMAKIILRDASVIDMIVCAIVDKESSLATVLSRKNKKDYKIQRDLKKLYFYLILLYLVFISFS
jgi:hypothetical protein